MGCYSLALAVGLTLACLLAQNDAGQEQNDKQIERAVSSEDKDNTQSRNGRNGDFLEQLKEPYEKFFQDIYVAQLTPAEIEFGHVREDPNSWEQRFEQRNLKNHRHRGKVKWGDRFGGYGEHYFDLNHDGYEPKEKEELDDDKANAALGKQRAAEAVKKTPMKIPADIMRDRRNLLERGEVEYLDERARQSIESGTSGLHGGNYKSAEHLVVKRQTVKELAEGD